MRKSREAGGERRGLFVSLVAETFRFPWRPKGLRYIDFPTTNNEQRNSNNGFSLAEVSVAAVVLAVSLLAIYGVYIRTYQVSGRTETRQIATALAQESMENILNKPFSNIALWANSDPAPPSTYAFTNKDGAQSTESMVKTSSGSASSYATYQEQVSEKGIVFTLTTIITWRDDNSDNTGADDPDPNDYKRVHVSVSWDGGSPVVLDRFVSMYYRPFATSTGGSDAGEFRLSDNSYARLGSTSLETYTGGNKTSRSQAVGFSTNEYSTSSNISTSVFTDDNSASAAPDNADNEKTVNYVNNSPPPRIYYKTGASSTAKVSAAATVNTLGSELWHAGEFGSENIWPDWTPSSSWSDSWALPSSIAKTTLSTGMEWDYDPEIPPDQNFQLFETGDAFSGTKSVITTSLGTNKIANRSWSKINDIHIIEKPGDQNGMVSIGSVESLVDVEANGVDGGAQVKVLYWKITDLRVSGYSDPVTVDSTSITYPLLGSAFPTMPAPIESIKIAQSPTSSTSADGKQAQAKITALVIEINNAVINQGSWNITVPESTITLGIAEANVSYTTM